MASMTRTAGNRESLYPVAKSAGERIHTHFLRERDRAQGSEPTGALASVESIEALINAAFWTSLRREEGYLPRISFAYVAPDEISSPLLLSSPLPLTPHRLSKVAPAIERPGIHLGIWPQDGELAAWGTTRQLPPLCLVLEIVAPGLLVVKHRRSGEPGKFVNVAVLQGDQVKVIDTAVAAATDCPALVSRLLGMQTRLQPSATVSVLVELSVSMRAHGRGGTILVVPQGDDSWKQSVAEPFGYALAPFTPLAELARNIADAPLNDSNRQALRRAVDAIAGLTAVDGATVITDQYEVLAFGAKIVQRAGSPRVEQLLTSEPIEGGEAVLTEPGILGGTRHSSAAQFAHDQRRALALVASQDGRFTAFEWSSCESLVHARRLEVLLL